MTEQITAKEFRAWRYEQRFRTDELKIRAMQLDLDLHVLDSLPADSCPGLRAEVAKNLKQFYSDYEASK